jgi:PAS domain-containing protein
VSDGGRHKSVVLILAREFATRLATPMFITDADGNLIFFNEPAEQVVGRAFADSGEMPAAEWRALFKVEDPEGKPMPLEKLPSGIALNERRPSHANLTVLWPDGRYREIAVTAFPLFSRTAEFEGAVIVFWEEPGAPAG